MHPSVSRLAYFGVSLISVSTYLISAGTIVKRQLQNNFSGLFYGLSFTKPNTDFVQSVKSQFSHDSKILVVCQEGLRSAGEANKLEAAGFQNIACITSGLQSVKPGLHDVEGSSELQDAGKAGSVQVQGKISAVRSWDRTHLCVTFHNFLCGSSREDPCTCSFELEIV